MKLTKYEHACFTVEKDGKVIIVDPGSYTTDFIAPENVVAIVLTHIHSDHFDRDLLATIIDKNPDAIVIAPRQVTGEIEVFETRSVDGGDRVTVDPFDLEFFGGQHATIYGDASGSDQNVGVFINDLVYYPGDSFSLPNKPVDTLALPVAAPWAKFSEVIDFLKAVKPRFAFPTHDAILSQIGKNLPDSMTARFVPDVTYRRIDGQTIDV